MLACVGVIVYLKWPLDEETLFRRGAELMASRRLSDQEEAWSEYLEPLERRFPETSHRDELDKFRRKRISCPRGPSGPRSEAERFVREGIDLSAREKGQEAAAARVFKQAIIAFDKDAAVKSWVDEAHAINFAGAEFAGGPGESARTCPSAARPGGRAQGRGQAGRSGPALVGARGAVSGRSGRRSRS